MLSGYIDSVTSSGYIEGWAFDRDAPTRALAVAVTDRDGAELAWGLAHRYRADLASARCGLGWCAFRLRATVSVSRLRKIAAVLRDRRSGAEICRVDPLPYGEGADPPLASVEELAAADPTVLGAIEQLHGCEELFGDFVKRHGVEGFVRAAYVYVLGRPGDTAGRAQYGRLLRDGRTTPYALLRTLANSEEFRARPRPLPAPNAPGFPFAGFPFADFPAADQPATPG